MRLKLAEYATQQTKEIWKTIVGYKHQYEVSNLGRVRRIETGHIIAIQDDWYSGYKKVRLSKKGKAKTMKSAPLVARAFLGFRGDREINHKDLNKANNQADNLEYTDRVGNMRHAAANGAFKKKPGRPRKGQRPPLDTTGMSDAERIKALTAWKEKYVWN